MIGRGQFMNLCRPPAALTTPSPGLRCRCRVLQMTSCDPVCSAASLVSVLTEAWVATVTSVGVSTSPCGVFKTPRRPGVRWECLILVKAWDLLTARGRAAAHPGCQSR